MVSQWGRGSPTPLGAIAFLEGGGTESHYLAPSE